MKTRTLVVVGMPTLAETVGTEAMTREPHFHCSGVDAGTVAELYSLLCRDPERFGDATSALRILYSKATVSKSVYVFLLPAFVVERVGEVADVDVPAFAARWSDARGAIRFPKAAGYYQELILNFRRLAQMALEDDKALLLRVEYSGAYNSLLKPTR